jgi:hypothetical protein
MAGIPRFTSSCIANLFVELLRYPLSATSTLRVLEFDLGGCFSTPQQGAKAHTTHMSKSCSTDKHTYAALPVFSSKDVKQAIYGCNTATAASFLVRSGAARKLDALRSLDLLPAGQTAPYATFAFTSRSFFSSNQN